MLILNVIDNDLACDCAVCRVLIMTLSPILLEFYSLKTDCTTSCIIFGIKHLLKAILFYGLRRL